MFLRQAAAKPVISEAAATWFLEINEIQRDLDRFLTCYNLQRTHQGYRLKGRTPVQALMEAMALTEPPTFHSPSRLRKRTREEERKPRKNQTRRNQMSEEYPT